MLTNLTAQVMDRRLFCHQIIAELNRQRLRIPVVPPSSA